MRFGYVGAVQSPNFKQYQPVVVPASVRAYVSGQFVAKPGAKLLAWSVRWPGGEYATKSEVADYESSMVNTINGAMQAFKNFKPGDPTMPDAQAVLNDINVFSNYSITKFQDTDGLVTGAASAKFYSIYFGDFEAYRALMEWLTKQSAEAANEKMSQATLLVGDQGFNTSSAKNKFYREKIVPLGSKFSSSDQQFLRDVFVLQMDGTVTLADLVKAVSLLSSHLSTTELAPILQFGYQMVLGTDLASNMLNSDSKLSYNARNIEAEVLEIRGKAQAVFSRLGSWLKAETPQLLEDRLTIHRAGYQNPNDPRYSVCGDVCNRIQQNVRDTITTGLTTVFGTKVDSSKSTMVTIALMAGVFYYLLKGRQ